MEQADIVAFLAAHKESKRLDVKTDLDFYGVMK